MSPPTIVIMLSVKLQIKKIPVSNNSDQKFTIFLASTLFQNTALDAVIETAD